MTSPAQTIDELVLPLVTAAGLELWDVEVNARMVRVLVDRPGGIDLEVLAGLARIISAALDTRDELAPGSHYQLEVSSPGVERTLRAPAHYERFIGSTVAVKTELPIAGSRRFQGDLLAADETGITVGLDSGPLHLAYDQVHKAHTVLVWGPGARSKEPAARSKTRSGVADSSYQIKGVAR